MFGSIVVGVDESGGGRDATALARELVGPDGKVTLVTVLPRNSYDAPRAVADYEASGLMGSLDDFVQKRALAHLSGIRDQAWSGAGLDVGVRAVVAGSIGRCLHEVAEDVAADLLVVGSTRHNLLGRVFMGDDTAAALNGAPCAVAIAPTGYAEHPAPFTAIGVAYDGSPESEHALEVARELAARHGATVSAATAVAVPVSSFGPGPLPLRDAIDALVRQAHERVDALGGVAAHVGYGAPIDVLASFSESVGLLVVGSRGYGPLGRLVHGSTSWQVVRNARCAVLVLPRGARATAPRDRAAAGSHAERQPDDRTAR